MASQRITADCWSQSISNEASGRPPRVALRNWGKPAPAQTKSSKTQVLATLCEAVLARKEKIHLQKSSILENWTTLGPSLGPFRGLRPNHSLLLYIYYQFLYIYFVFQPLKSCLSCGQHSMSLELEIQEIRFEPFEYTCHLLIRSWPF